MHYKNGRQFIRPSPLGAHNWQPMSFNPLTGLVYIPIIDSVNEMDPLAHYKHEEGFWNTGMAPMTQPPGEVLFQEAMLKSVLGGALLAWDPVKQEERWRIKHSLTWNGGTLSTAGNLVLQGTADQSFKAFRADTGEALWRYPTQTGVMAAPITYTVDGEQYIAVQAGWGGGFGIAAGLKPPPGPTRSRILAFKLGGDQMLPPVAERIVYDPPAPQPTNEEILKEGNSLYRQYCSRCHGMSVVSSGSIPDLRYMHKSRHEDFQKIVRDGALQKVGMPGFSTVLDKKQADAIHVYIIGEANKDLERREHPSPQWWINLKTWFYLKIGALVNMLL